jgi:hypothetical protein
LVTEHRCAKCNGPVDLHDTYVIGYCKQTAMEWIYLCEDCEDDLREWLASGGLGGSEFV